MDDIIAEVGDSGRAMSVFVEKLERACDAHRSLLCVGLDPDPKRMPPALSVAEGVGDVLRFNRDIIDATADLVCAFKPNLAFYEALGLPGLEALQETVAHIRRHAPDVLIIGDAKRGDVEKSAQAYATALFDVWGFDATTVNAYGGHDTVEPFLQHHERGVFIWCRSSNPGSRDVQDLSVAHGAEPRAVYEQIAINAERWNVNGNLGLVVGATYPQELKAVRELCRDMPILIPGVGAQGGGLEEAVRWGTDARGRLAIVSSSRQVLYASSGEDFAQAARREAMKLRDAINQVLEREGKGWS